jgi:hypothetical protein
MMWGQTYGKFRLERVLSGRSLLTTILSTIVTGLMELPGCKSVLEHNFKPASERSRSAQIVLNTGDVGQDILTSTKP